MIEYEPMVDFSHEHFDIWKLQMRTSRREQIKSFWLPKQGTELVHIFVQPLILLSISI